MRNLILVTLLACAALAIGSCAMADNGPGHDYYAESTVIPPGEDFPLWEYIYTLENYSTDHTIVSWTWSYGGNSGDVMPNPHAETLVFTSGDDIWPLPASGVSDDDIVWRSEIFDDPAEPFDVTSVIRFDDGFESPCDISIPMSAIPEPASVLALLSGFVGMVGFARRRRA